MIKVGTLVAGHQVVAQIVMKRSRKRIQSARFRMRSCMLIGGNSG
jgi:hypothetical protein